MAQRLTISQALDKVFANAEYALRYAVNKTATTIAPAMQKKAMELVGEYYKQYKPNVYRRTKSLYKMITPYDSMKQKNVRYKTETAHSGRQVYNRLVGVRFDSRKLNNAYHSNSRYHQDGKNWNDVNTRSNSSANGVPDAGWIVGNFWDGIHPATNGAIGSHSKDGSFGNFATTVNKFHPNGVIKEESVQYKPIRSEPIKPMLDKWLKQYGEQEVPMIILKQFYKLMILKSKK